MKIDKNIPIPEDANVKRGRPRIHPFYKMEVMDSVEIRGEAACKSAKSAIYIETKKGKKFCSKRLIDGTRFWRIS